MKFCIEGDYKDTAMEGKIEIQGAEDSDFKDFIMYGMTGLIQDLFEKFGKNLKEEAKRSNMSEDKIIGVISLVSIMCLNTLSEKLTSTLNDLLADDESDSEEDSEENNQNRWNLLLGDK